MDEQEISILVIAIVIVGAFIIWLLLPDVENLIWKIKNLKKRKKKNDKEDEN
jgi:hypothetical protein